MNPELVVDYVRQLIAHSACGSGAPKPHSLRPSRWKLMRTLDNFITSNYQDRPGPLKTTSIWPAFVHGHSASEKMPYQSERSAKGSLSVERVWKWRRDVKGFEGMWRDDIDDQLVCICQWLWAWINWLMIKMVDWPVGVKKRSQHHWGNLKKKFQVSLLKSKFEVPSPLRAAPSSPPSAPL